MQVLARLIVVGEGRAKTAHQKSPACGRKAQISSYPGSIIGREQPRGNMGSAWATWATAYLEIQQLKAVTNYLTGSPEGRVEWHTLRAATFFVCFFVYVFVLPAFTHLLYFIH